MVLYCMSSHSSYRNQQRLILTLYNVKLTLTEANVSCHSHCIKFETHLRAIRWAHHKTRLFKIASSNLLADAGYERTLLRLISILPTGCHYNFSYNIANSRNLTSLRNTRKALIKWSQYEQLKVIKDILYHGMRKEEKIVKVKFYLTLNVILKKN
uniref:Uncharacterized protein n=1 Tax=Glossina palpalis gambiensis TaxID=67801 RepID=A0A1B0BQ55_9MUSC